MMPVSIFVSRLGIIDLVNKIKIYTKLIKLIHFEIHIILFLFKFLSKYVIIFGNITWINIFIIVRRKSDTNLHVFLYSKLTKFSFIDKIPSSRKIYTNNKKSVKVGFWRTLVSFQGDPPAPQLAATPPRPSIPFGRSATCLQTPGQSLSRLGTVQAHFYAFPALLHPELAVLQQLVDLEGHLLERVLHIHAKLAGSLHEEEIVVVGELLGLFCGHLLNCELRNEDLFFYAIQLKRGKILPHFTCDGWMIFQLEVRSSFSRAFKCTKSRTLFYIRKKNIFVLTV